MESRKEKTLEETEQEVALKYKQLQQETQLLVAKILEIEDEKREHEYSYVLLKSM